MTETTTQMHQQIKTFTDWTYYLGIFDGVIKTSAAAIYNDDWVFKIDNADDKAKTLALLKSLYETVAQTVNNFNQAIDQLNNNQPVTYTLVPYQIPMGSFLPMAGGQKPRVIKDAWNTVKPGITLLLPGLAKDPLLLETVKALLNQGEQVVAASAELIEAANKT